MLIINYDYCGAVDLTAMVEVTGTVLCGGVENGVSLTPKLGEMHALARASRKNQPVYLITLYTEPTRQVRSLFVVWSLSTHTQYIYIYIYIYIQTPPPPPPPSTSTATFTMLLRHDSGPRGCHTMACYSPRGSRAPCPARGEDASENCYESPSEPSSSNGHRLR